MRFFYLMKEHKQIYDKFISKVKSQSLYNKEVMLEAMKNYSNKELKDFIESAKYLQLDKNCGEIFRSASTELQRRLVLNK